MRNKFIVGLLLSLLAYINTANAAPLDVDLTTGIWSITAEDNAGITWNDSTIDFQTQIADGDNWLLTGQFYWIGSNGAFGGENFTGTLYLDSSLELFGFELVPPTLGIVLGSYFATLGASGNEILNGSWDGSGIPSDDWSAVRPIPLPGAVWLLVSALLGLRLTRRQAQQG